MTRFKRLAYLTAAIARGEVPADVVSPGAAAAALGITRQSVYERMKRGTLRAWGAEGVVLIDARSLRQAVRQKRGIPPGQGELNVATP